MGNFKNFFLNSDFSHIDSYLNQFANKKELDDQLGKAMDQTQLSQLAVPKIEKTGRIIEIRMKKNPILIRLSDGTECNLTLDEFQSVPGHPAVGKMAKVVFQRHPGDTSGDHSLIQKFEIID